MGLLGSTYKATGEVWFQGKNLLSLSKKECQKIYGKEICFIMQNPMTAFNPSLRVGKQLEKTFLQHHARTSKDEMFSLFDKTLRQLGLEDTERILKSYPFTLSGGMLQRLMITAALINQPQILVADEATTAIDACNRVELMKELKSLCKEGMSILFVTHDLRAASYSDQLLIMNHGKIVESGETKSIIENPKQEYTEYLLNACRLERRELMIEVKNLSCSFSEGAFTKNKFTAVSPISAIFKNGGRYAIVGESGSGKTTLARMIAGLQRPDNGNVLIDGIAVYGRRRIAEKEHFKKVQIIQQNSASALDPKMTIGKSIEEPLSCFFHMEKAVRKKRCEELMALCNLPVDYYARLPSELSGGEQKRVAIARALAASPECLIFDEATNGFDLPLRKKIMEEIIELQKKVGFTLIFITHDMELAVVVADEILVMRNSHLIEQVAFSGDTSAFTNSYSKVLLEASGII